MYAIETTPHSGYYRVIGYPRGEEGSGVFPVSTYGPDLRL